MVQTLYKQRGPASDFQLAPIRVQVVRFHVWQDLTPTSTESAPVHATVTIEISEDYSVSAEHQDGAIRLETPGGKSFVEGRLVVNRVQYGLGLAEPGKKQVQLTMLPVPAHRRLDNVDKVKGTVYIRISERIVSVRLPETKIIFAW